MERKFLLGKYLIIEIKILWVWKKDFISSIWPNRSKSVGFIIILTQTACLWMAKMLNKKSTKDLCLTLNTKPWKKKRAVADRGWDLFYSPGGD